CLAEEAGPAAAPRPREPDDARMTLGRPAQAFFNALDFCISTHEDFPRFAGAPSSADLAEGLRERRAELIRGAEPTLGKGFEPLRGDALELERQTRAPAGDLPGQGGRAVLVAGEAIEKESRHCVDVRGGSEGASSKDLWGHAACDVDRRRGGLAAVR